MKALISIHSIHCPLGSWAGWGHISASHLQVQPSVLIKFNGKKKPKRNLRGIFHLIKINALGLFSNIRHLIQFSQTCWHQIGIIILVLKVKNKKKTIFSDVRMCSGLSFLKRRHSQQQVFHQIMFSFNYAMLKINTS